MYDLTVPLQKHYSQQQDKVGEIQTDLDELKGIMVKNIGKLRKEINLIWNKIGDNN